MKIMDRRIRRGGVSIGNRRQLGVGVAAAKKYRGQRIGGRQHLAAMSNWRGRRAMAAALASNAQTYHGISSSEKP
jgi:hypothetical protein